jgi:DNA-directed RNA polymerase subunit RPC12/RpoP
MIPAGTEIHCPACGKHYVTTTLPILDTDSRSSRGFMYADGSQPSDYDKVECRNCGAPMLDVIQHTVSRKEPV